MSSRFAPYLLTLGDTNTTLVLGGVLHSQAGKRLSRHLTDIFSTRGGPVSPRGAVEVSATNTGSRVHLNKYVIAVEEPIFPNYFFGLAETTMIPTSMNIVNITMWIYRVPVVAVSASGTVKPRVGRIGMSWMDGWSRNQLCRAMLSKTWRPIATSLSFLIHLFRVAADLSLY